MTLRANFRTSQAQVFKLGNVISVLQMSVTELDDHIAETAQQNPFLQVRQRRSSAHGTASTTDVLETTAADDASNLYDHVLRQLAGPVARGGVLARIIIALVEDLEPTGWLGRGPDLIARDLGIPESVLNAALAFVQQRVEPAGLFARNLTECLRLQLVDRDLWSGPMERVLDKLDTFENAGLDGLIAGTGLAHAQVETCLDAIRRLDPKPGARFQFDHTLMRDPDVTVERAGDGWEIRLKYDPGSDLVLRGPQSCAASSDMRAALASAKSLKQALEMRRSALERIMRFIVSWQEAFLLEGPEKLKPLTMSQIAQATGFHLSTVSRVLNGLLVQCPNGIIAARDLCPKRCTIDAKNGSAKPRVISRIRALLQAEDRAAPLSDPRLADLLRQEGLQVSRRVVTKYRQEIGLSSAACRRIQP